VSGGLVIVIVVLGLGVVIGIGVLGALQAKKRREAFAAVAAARGWAYAARDDRWVGAFDGPPFGTGNSRRADNVLTGTYDGRPLVAFDYDYTTTSTSTDANGHTTQHTEHHHHSVVGIDTGAAFPELSVSPEGMFGRMIGRMTGHDIELESEDFNRAFTVHCPDRKFASDVLHPQMMEYVLTLRGLAWRVQRGYVLAISTGDHSIAQVDATLTAIDGIIDRIPDFVWQACGVQDAGRPEKEA
jgi:hypothetical protein